MRYWFLVVLWLAAGCQSARHAATAPAPKPYTRVANPDAGTVQLQIAVRKFLPAHQRGPAIWLAGVMHVGEPQYYQALQSFLDARTVVLYEGVNTSAHQRRATPAIAGKPTAPPADSEMNSGFSMQSALAKSLGLVFQLDAIDYDRTNFFNRDLSINQLQKLMVQDLPTASAKPGQTAQTAKTSPSFDALLQIMDGSSFLGGMFKLGIQFIGANPKLQAMSKLTLIEMVSRFKGDFSDMKSLPPDMKQLIKVLIEARNQNVVADLQTELKRLPRSSSIAVFYGTGHMEDLEKRLLQQLHYHPVEETWLTVFEVNLQKSGIAPGELQMMRNLVKWQLDQMQ